MSKNNLLIWRAFQTEKMVGTCEILGKERQIKYVCLYYIVVENLYLTRVISLQNT